MLDRKGLISFLFITFGLTYVVEIGMITAGLRFTQGVTGIFAQLVIMSVMWVPALATVITTRLVTREGLGNTGLRFPPLGVLVWTGLSVPLLFALIFGVTWLLGFGHPDWRMAEFQALYANQGSTAELPLPAGAMLAVIFLGSTLVSPFLNSLVAFGEEWGWRGYLLPKLMPLGKPRAYVLSGVIWGLWHAPLVAVGFGYPGLSPWVGIPLFVLFTTALGMSINELSLRYRSSVLAAWLHGLFNSQRFGVWAVLFAGANPVFGGSFGFIGILVWLGMALFIMRVWPAPPTAAAESHL